MARARWLATVTLAILAQGPLEAQPSGGVGSGDTPAVAAADRLEALRRNIWWNQAEVVEGLRLSDEQRAGMDRALGHFLESRRGAQERQRQALGELSESLEAGDLERAEETVATLREATGELTSGQAQLMLDVVRLLAPGQRQAAAEAFPWIFRRSWLVGSGGRRGGPWSRPGGGEPPLE